MTATLNSAKNGQKRPSLAEQINRLDQTLDGLADSLNGAVADAVKDAVGNAVREAVQTVLTEVLTNPEVIAKLTAAMAPPAIKCEPTKILPQHEPPKIVTQDVAAPAALRERLDTVFGRVRASLADLRKACGERLRQARTWAGNAWQGIMESLRSLAPAWEMVRHFRVQIATAVVIGILVGIAVWQAGPWLGVVTSTIGGFVTSMAVQIGLWLRRKFGACAEPTEQSA